MRLRAALPMMPAPIQANTLMLTLLMLPYDAFQRYAFVTPFIFAIIISLLISSFTLIDALCYATAIFFFFD